MSSIILQHFSKVKKKWKVLIRNKMSYRNEINLRLDLDYNWQQAVVRIALSAKILLAKPLIDFLSYLTFHERFQASPVS
jgi:hypothetical protein